MFENREEAGELLADKLGEYENSGDVLVLGIPRGGMPVASVIASKLNLPLWFVVTRKVGAPGQKELAIGAIGPEGVRVFDKNLISRLGVAEDYIDSEVENEKKELQERIEKFGGERKVNLKNKTAILVDDGIATGATVEAAIKYLRKKEVKKIVLAVPVVPSETVDEMEKLVDEFVVINAPREFYAVGQFYKNFPQTTNEEVLQLLQNDRGSQKGS